MTKETKMNKEKLQLKKTHDICVSKKPRLTVVMLHGISSSSKTYTKALKYLEKVDSLKDVRFVTFDLLGSGESPKSDELNYGFDEQIEALDNAIEALNATGPIVLVGHSMGCLISIRYADTHKRKIKELILLSPPIYRPEDFKNPIFVAGQDAFKKAVFQKDPTLKTDKAFNNELKLIVMNQHNYDIYEKIDKPTTLIFGLADQIIASFNIPRLLKNNKHISAVEVPDAHSITHEKYIKVVPILERILDETI